MFSHRRWSRCDQLRMTSICTIISRCICIGSYPYRPSTQLNSLFHHQQKPQRVSTSFPLPSEMLPTEWPKGAITSAELLQKSRNLPFHSPKRASHPLPHSHLNPLEVAGVSFYADVMGWSKQCIFLLLYHYLYPKWETCFHPRHDAPNHVLCHYASPQWLPAVVRTKTPVSRTLSKMRSLMTTEYRWKLVVVTKTGGWSHYPRARGWATSVGPN